MSITFKEYDPLLGITTTVHDVDGQRTFQKTYDASPFLDLAKDMRTETEGQKWGEFRHVGFIPPAELGKMMRQDGGLDKARLVKWLKENPALVTYGKFLKK